MESPNTENIQPTNNNPSPVKQEGVQSENISQAVGNLALSTPQLLGNVLSFLITKYIQIINLWFEKLIERVGLSLGPETDWPTENEKSKVILKRIGNITLDVLQDEEFRRILMEIKNELTILSNQIVLPLINEVLDVLQPIIDEQGNKLINTGTKGIETAIEKGIQSAVTAANAAPPVNAMNLTANAISSGANAVGKSLEGVVIGIETLIKFMEGMDAKGKAITEPLKKAIESFNRVKALFDDTKNTIDSLTNKINSFNPNSIIPDTPKMPTAQMPTAQMPQQKAGGKRRKTKKKRRKKRKRNTKKKH